MTANQLLNVYNDYTVDMDEYEADYPFDLETAMDRPAAPAQSIAAQAGELIAERGGLVRAMAVALTHTMDGSNISDQQRAVYMELVIAAVES